MPTRSALFLLFVLLVCIPVGAAVYLGTAGLERERAMLLERERDRLEQRADEIRDALVRELQQLWRQEAGRTRGLVPQTPRGAPVQDRFSIPAPGRVDWPADPRSPLPADIRELARSAAVARALQRSAPTGFSWKADLAYRTVEEGGRCVVAGFRVDVERLAQRFLDPVAPRSVVPRLDERVERVRLIRDDPREKLSATDARGLPQVLYRHVVPPGRNAAPVLIPPGYLLALEVHPAAALDRDLKEAGGGLAWTLGAVAFVVGLGALFFWRALRAETRLAARKEEFVNAVSHELRTPLTSIRMYADMLKEGWVENPETAREYVGLMAAESERLARLVNNVLDFSRIEKGRKAFDMRIGDPAPVVREAAEALRPYLREKGFELALEVPDSLPACRFDRDALTRILVNLIDNAVKYGQREVRIEADAPDGHVRLCVLDRGPGIAPDEKEHVFEAFWRGRDAASGGGSGLGLALVHHYVEAHHGRIRVDDRDGGGSVFALWLPVAGDAA